MATFLNINFDKPIQWNFLFRHILFLIIWGMGLAILIFRIDLYIPHDNNNHEWLLKIIPYTYLCVLVSIFLTTKWYYNIALLFYPLLVFFWFLPKIILSKGKIYLFSNYVNNIINFFKHFKTRIINIGVFITTIVIVSIFDSDVIRVGSLIVFSYFYYRFVVNYIKMSFRPPQLFGVNAEKIIEGIAKSPEKGMVLIKFIDDLKIDEKIEEKEAEITRVERLIMLNFVISRLKENLDGVNWKKAFIISWIYQLLGFLTISLLFFTFINFELFRMSANNFHVINSPNIFDFFYYTIKSITFSSIDSIIPISTFARCVEIMSFLTLGIFLLMIVTSVLFSLRQDHLSENIKKATSLCIIQNDLIIEVIKEKYQTDIKTFVDESKKIKESLRNLKNILDKLWVPLKTNS